MSDQLKNQIAIVTGAGRGIGAATAKLFAAEGARVVLVSRTISELQKTQLEIQKNSSSAAAEIFAADVSLERDVGAIFNFVTSKFGSPTILVNNAAILKTGHLSAVSLEDWSQMLAVNLTGMFLMCREALNRMKAGCIINLSSVAGLQGFEKFSGLGAYAAGKAGVIGLSEALAADAKNQNIRVHCFAPGAVATEMLAQAAPGYKTETQPSDVALELLKLSLSSSTGSVVVSEYAHR